MTTSDPKCEHGISLSDLCEYANHRANDPIPGDNDELLYEADHWRVPSGEDFSDDGDLIHELAAALRTEQSARQAAEREIEVQRRNALLNYGAYVQAHRRAEAAEERERALIAGVKEALEHYDPYAINGADAESMNRILSRLLPSTPEEGKN